LQEISKMSKVKRWMIQFEGTTENINNEFLQLQKIVSFAKGHWKVPENNDLQQCHACIYFLDRYRITELKKLLNTAVITMQPFFNESDFVNCLRNFQEKDTSNRLPITIGKFIPENEQRRIKRQLAWKNCQNKTTKDVLSIVQKIDERGSTSAIKNIFDTDPDKILQIQLATNVYHKMVKNEMEYKLLEEAKKVEWKNWQQHLFDILSKKPDPRRIYVVVDPIGNTGKTFFVQNFRRLFPETTVSMNNCKTSDMLHAAQLCVERRVVLIDLMRSEKENIPYDGIEALKNGSFITSKYKSKFVDGFPPHMVVFTNFELNYQALSLDRWTIIRLQKQNNSETITFTESKI
jgi:hypothetical protein